VPITVVPTAYGRAASETLFAAIAQAKRDEPLAPVTIVVPTNSVGVAARRLLASGDLGALTAGARGVVGVTFLTVFRLAELLGAPRLAAARRRPVSTPVVASAVRNALADRPGIFAPVAAHPATEEALVAASRELADLDDAQLDELAAQHRRAHEVVRLHRATRTRLAESWYDEHDLMRAAGTAIADGAPLLADLGAVVCFLPQRWSPPAARLLHALGEVCSVTVIAGLTGSARADAAVVASVERLGAKIDERTRAAMPRATGTAVLSASDADDEVRSIVRGIVGAMREGVPLERMAVLYGTEDPYARLVHEHLALAGIAHNGATVRTLANSVLGRALLRILALPDDNFRRDDVCALFASAPMLDGQGRPVPATVWERVSRKAGVVGGVDQWRSRLDSYAAGLGTEERHERERARAAALGAYVAALASELDPAQLPHTWRGYAALAHRLIRRFLGADARRAEWPQVEQDAAGRVEAAIDRIGALDSVDDAPNLTVFRRTLELELDAARDRVGRLGEGVLAGPVGLALGVDLDRVWVCGLAEGVFPHVPHDDPLLGDNERAVLEGDLPLRAERVDDSERAMLAALASCSGARVCTWPRGDLRRSTEHVPSRFLADTLAAVAPEQITTVASFAQGIAACVFPATEHELGVRAALADQQWVRALPNVERSRALLRARASGEFTRFDGNLAHLRDQLRAISPLDSDRAISPTRLELWADCPHAYLMQSILHVEPVERPEEIMQISPLDRGSMVHDVLDRFLAAGERERDRLRTLGEAAFASAEAKGLTGRRLLWERDRRVILSELDAFFGADDHWRVTRAAETLATELPFGFNEREPVVEVAWADGRWLRLRGKADRIDRTHDGTLVVIDYKTGSPDPYTGLSAADPVQRGMHLQLPVYALAARAAFGDAGIEAYYWFVGRGNNRLVGYPVDDAIHHEFMNVARTIVDNIEGGVFVSRPPTPAPRPFVLCPFCDPDGMGTAERWREWERKHEAPELAGYRALLEGVEADDDD
jgi:ATP-dependent helicase/nuclease subunit B